MGIKIQEGVKNTNGKKNSTLRKRWKYTQNLYFEEL